MSVSLTVEVTKDTATKAVRDLIAKTDPHRLATAIVPPLTRHWRDHLKALPRNKHGYPSTGFWEEAARRVIGIAVGGAAKLTCDKLGVRQRYYGGAIKASHATNLTIPICAEAYGTTVRDWGRDNLTLVILADGRKFFALWLGDESSQRIYKETAGRKSKRAEVSTRRAQQYGSRATGGKPKVIIFKKSSGHTIARAEKHADLKFLFKLQPQTEEQAANPDLIPSDLTEVAREKILEFVK